MNLLCHPKANALCAPSLAWKWKRGECLPVFNLHMCKLAHKNFQFDFDFQFGFKRGAWKLYPFHSLCHLTQVGLKAWMQHVASHVYQTVSTTCFVDVIAVYSQKLSWMNAFNRSENCNVDSDLTLMSYCVFSCVSYRLTGVALEKAK